MRETLRTPSELTAAGLVAPEQAAALQAVAERYAVAIPPALAALIDPSEPRDPIARPGRGSEIDPAMVVAPRVPACPSNRPPLSPMPDRRPLAP